MTKLKLITCSIVSTLFLYGCSQVLESVSLPGAGHDVKLSNTQEEFDINIRSLTFKNARQANKDPYPRQLMLTGIGTNANVFDEADFLNSHIPDQSTDLIYRLGIGDRLSYVQYNNEFAKSASVFPTQTEQNEYRIGVGDELTFIQMSDARNAVTTTITDDDIKLKPIESSILKTSSIVGTDGNILLLGLGSIQARNRTLNEVRTEVRNVLIRNGLAPSFQLEISGFNSKKAFISFVNSEKNFVDNVIYITNLPITLKELAIKYFQRSSSQNTSFLGITRNGQNFRFTADEIFSEAFPVIVVKDKDIIEINESEKNDPTIEAVVGSKGNILLPGIGSIKAINRSLAELHTEIDNILTKQGIVPNFQLEISGFESKKFFLISSEHGSQISSEHGSQVIPLTNTRLSLKEAILSGGTSTNSDFVLINLERNGSSYQMTFQEMLNGIGSKILIENGDTIELKAFKYKPGQVFALSGAGNAELVMINPSKRETLADILFTEKGPLNNLLAKRSEVYLLRGKNPSVAYHLDAQNVSRILVAAKTELRPNDIVYVADRPIISFARTLEELLPLRILLRDIQNDEIP